MPLREQPRCRRTFPGVERPAAIDLLPEAYARALRLRDAGSEASIAQALQIAPEAVAPLLRLAEAKLASIMAAEPP